MDKMLKERDRLSETWHKQAHLWGGKINFTFASSDQYFAFCASKDWLQDTGEALLDHRRVGFSSDPMSAYLEFWSILQAAFVQQDAIQEMHYAFTGLEKLDKKVIAKETAWAKLRSFRNYATGHPTRQGTKSIKRCVSGRQPKSYETIQLSVYEQHGISNEVLDLGKFLDAYDREAAEVVRDLHDILKAQLAGSN